MPETNKMTNFINNTHREVIKATMKSRGYNKEEILNAVCIIEELEKRNVKNYDKFRNYLFGKICEKAAFKDTLTEGKVALIFAYNGFNVTYLGHKKGPDLLVEGFGHRFYVEVKRYRKDMTTERKLSQYSDKGELIGYGRGADGAQKDYNILCRDILEKTKQLPKDQIGIVFIWSEDDKIGKGDFRTCINMISDESLKYKYERQYKHVTIHYIGSREKLTIEEKQQSKNLSGILFYSKEKVGPDFWFFLNLKAQNPISRDLTERLKKLQKPKEFF